MVVNEIYKIASYAFFRLVLLPNTSIYYYAQDIYRFVFLRSLPIAKGTTGYNLLGQCRRNKEKRNTLYRRYAKWPDADMV